MPFGSNEQKSSLPNGKLEKQIIDEDTFREQFYNFKKYGVFLDPSGGGSQYIQKNQGSEHYLDFTVEKVILHTLLI